MSADEKKRAIREFIDRIDYSTHAGQTALDFLYGAAMRFRRNAKQKGGAE